MPINTVFSGFSNNTLNDNKNSQGSAVLSHLSMREVFNYVRAHGVKCRVQKAILCPCLEKHTGQPKINCAICNGVGFFYDGDVLVNEESQCTDHKFIVVERRGYKNLQEKGGITSNGGMKVYMHTFEPALGDKIKPLRDIEVVNDERKIKGEKYSNGESKEVLLMQDVKMVECIYTVNAALSQATKYLPLVNFNLDGRKIAWIDGAPQPSNGQQYVVRYQATPEYIIMSSQPARMVEHDDDLPMFDRENTDTPLLWEIEMVKIDEYIKERHKA